MAQIGRDWIPPRDVRTTEPATPTRRLLVLFDIDGTLLDSGATIAETMMQAFLAAGEAPPSPARVRAAIGLSLPEMVDLLAPRIDGDVREKILNGYRLRYFDLVEQDEVLPVFPGAARALEWLASTGFALGVTTGKAGRSTQHMLRETGWAHLFHSVQCADGNPSKPAPDMVLRAQSETGFGPSEAVVVGDSTYDMQMARAAGVRAIGVSWGYSPVAELLAEGATAIARDFEHLVEILIRMHAERSAGVC